MINSRSFLFVVDVGEMNLYLREEEFQKVRLSMKIPYRHVTGVCVDAKEFAKMFPHALIQIRGLR